MLETLGRLHIVVVHFPIALLLVGGALELWNRRTRCASRAALARMCIALGAASAFVAVVLGWIHADHVRLGSSAADTLALHRWTGISTALIALAAVMLGRAARTSAGAGDKQRKLHLASVVLAMTLVAATAHFGGELVYGEGFLFEALTGSQSAHEAAPEKDHTSHTQPVVEEAPQPTPPATKPAIDFASQIRPILEVSCYECHGERKQKARLRLDQIDTALRQNEAGDWIIKRGDPAASELLRRVMLPLDDEDHMPSDDESLTAEQIELLRRWIELGAPTASLGTDSAPVDIPLVQAPPTPTITEPVIAPPPARDVIADALTELRNTGVIAGMVAQDSDLVEVDFHLRGASVTDEQLAALEVLAAKLVQLNLAHTSITDAGLAHVAKLGALETLNLSETAVGDAGLEHIARLAKLEVLNLYGTRISDRGLAQIASLASLERVYIWQTQVTEAGAAALATLRPDLTVVRGQ